MRSFKRTLGGISNGYQSLIEYFISPEMRQNTTKANQARMFLISHTIGPVLGNSVPLALYLFDPTPDYAVAVLSLSITAFWIYPFLLLRNFNYDVLVMTSVMNLNFAILWSCFHYGGVASPTLPWLLIIPILSLFYIGGEKRLQPHLLALSASIFVCFLGLYFYIQPSPNDLPVVAMQGLGIISTVAALCYVATMAIYYARVFDSGVELEQEVRRRMHKTNALRDAVAAADRAASIKADFLAGMSHELRTPLNAVIGYSEMLKEDFEDDNEVQSASDIDRITDAAHYLLRLINMILDLSKIEAGHMRFDMREQKMGEFLQQIVDQKREAVQQNGNVISVNVAAEVQKFTLDETQVSHIIAELVENAARHTNNGIISIDAQEHIKKGGEKFLRLSIKDTGVGIARENLPSLFESFYSEQEAASGRYGGTGLSLHVVQKLCHAMGGDISLTSQLGKGTTFVIDLPREYTEAEKHPETVEEIEEETTEEALAA